MNRLRHAALALCLFVIVVAANWATFERYGSDIPDWDQWDAEAANLLRPWFEHDHVVAHLFQAHNEHRVVLTKLQSLALCLVNGQWDSRVECCANALLHGLIAVGFWALARRWLALRWHAPLFAVLAALFALPMAWENLLGGFHSQQYWLVLTSGVAMVLLPWAAPGRAAWWLGLAAAVLALGSMGSGLLAAAVVFGVVVWRALGRELTWRATLPTLGAMTVLVVFGDLTRVTVPGHEALKARTAHDFVFSILRSLEWPLRDQDWAGLLLWAPWLILAIVTLCRWAPWRRAPGRTPRAALTLLALGAWVLVQLLATAFARGAGADYPAPRYMDTLIFATAVNALILGWLLSPPALVPPPLRPAAPTGLVFAVAGAWLLALGLGFRAQVHHALDDDLPATKQYYLGSEAHVRAYVATNDPTELVDPIPYLTADALVERLSHPAIRAVLPASVALALPLQPAATHPSADPFLRNWTTEKHLVGGPRAGLAPATPPLSSRATWGSFTSEGLAATGEWRSAPLTSPLGGWLKFETAGDVGQPGVSLELHDAATGVLLATVRPSKTPGPSWRSAYARAPRQPFIVVAQDHAPTRWLAFSAPVPMGPLSYLCWRAMENGVLLVEVALGAAALLGLWSWAATWRGPSRAARASAPPVAEAAS